MREAMNAILGSFRLPAVANSLPIPLGFSKLNSKAGLVKIAPAKSVVNDLTLSFPIFPISYLILILIFYDFNRVGFY